MDRVFLPTRLAIALSREPTCPICCSKHPQPALRTSWVIYYRCEDCGEIWSINRIAKAGNDIN